MTTSNPTHKIRNLLSIVELGGYPNFSAVYQRNGFEVVSVSSSRKAISAIKKKIPDVIVAEFNYQSDFRDRTSSLESVLAAVARFPKTKMIIFYEKEMQHQLEKLLGQFNVFKVLPYPIEEVTLQAVLQSINDE